MQDTSFSAMLQSLSNDHYNRVISMQEYRARRKKILDDIDRYFNGEVDDDTTQRNTTRKVSIGTTQTFSASEFKKD